jgi:hypothetical protein
MACLPQEEHLDPLVSSSEGSGKEDIALTTTASLPEALSNFDASQTTAKLCTIGLLITWLAVIGCLVAAVLVMKGPGESVDSFLRYIPLSNKAAEALSFIINILVACVTDCLGYIHGTSLRWALYREDRLEFNTNTRLFTNARKGAPNRWPSNVLCVASLILCYAAASLLFTRIGLFYEEGHAIERPVIVNRMAIAALGLGLMGQSSNSVLVPLIHIERNTDVGLEPTEQYTCMAQCRKFRKH